MELKNYKQYIHEGIVFGLFKGDCYSVGDYMLEFANESYIDDYCDISFKLTDLVTGDDDFGDYVFLMDDHMDHAMTGYPSFRNEYMKAFGEGIPKWYLVKADITLEYMTLYYLRFDSEQDECDEHGILRINYPRHIRFEIQVAEQEQNQTDKYVIDVLKGDNETPTITIEEYDKNGLKSHSSLMRDQRGVYLYVAGLHDEEALRKRGH